MNFWKVFQIHAHGYMFVHRPCLPPSLKHRSAVNARDCSPLAWRKRLIFFFASVFQTDGILSVSYWPVTICLYSTYFFTVFLLFEHIKWSISKKSKLVCFCVNQLLYLVWYKYHMSKLSRTLRSVSALAACLQRGSSQWWNVYSGLGWQTRVWLHWNYIPVDPGR